MSELDGVKIGYSLSSEENPPNALVEWACPNHEWILHVVSAAALLLAAAAGLIAYREWRAPAAVPRSSQYMATMGMALSALFFLVILAQEIPSWFLTPCQ